MHKKYIIYEDKHIRNARDTFRLKSRPVYGVDAKLVRCCSLKFWAAGRCDGESHPGQFCQADSLGPEPAGQNQDYEAPLHFLLLYPSHASIIRVYYTSSKFCWGPLDPSIHVAVILRCTTHQYTTNPPSKGCGLFERYHNVSKLPNGLQTTWKQWGWHQRPSEHWPSITTWRIYIQAEHMTQSPRSHS